MLNPSAAIITVGCLRVTVNGRDAGAYLISLGLAHRWR
jgi:hypothetical protein